jgi:hypothetical protein
LLKSRNNLLCSSDESRNNLLCSSDESSTVLLAIGMVAVLASLDAYPIPRSLMIVGHLSS